jgi:hypothetical protein
MNTRPNLPVALVAVLVVCCGLPGWAAAEPPAVGAVKSMGKSAPRPPQKPLTAASPSATPAASPKPAAASAAKSGPQVPAAPPAAGPSAAAPKLASPAPAATTVSSDAATVLRLAREHLTGNREKQSPNDIQTIRATLIERVAISGRRFRLEGTYLQGTDLRLRLELKVIPEDPQLRVEGSLLEVCNGTILWARYQVGKETRITRRDVSQILNASKSNGQINFSTVELGLGGLPALLAALDQWMKFDKVTTEELAVTGGGRRAFTVISGEWKDACRQDLLQKMSKQHLPEHVPDAVRIYLETDSLFPRRIAFLKRRGTQFESLVELDLLRPVTNCRFDEHEFEYAPPDGARPVDVTAEYLKQIQNAGP